MLKIGLTGGIGSGKSTTAALFEELGVPVIDADNIARDITQPNQIAFKPIIDHFGQSILNLDGTLNRQKIRDIVFHQPDEKKWLENTLHPTIREVMKEQLQKLNAPYCILVIPLLAESKNIAFLDRVLVIDLPESLQMERTQQRSQLNENTIRAIIKAQCTRKERLAIANDIIVNDSSISVLRDQVNQLHSMYLEIAGMTDAESN